MDSSQNWLGFSLSNNNTHHYQLESFNDTPTTNTSHSSTTDLSIFNFGPKLEDFLGVCDTNTTTKSPADIYQFSGDQSTTTTTTQSDTPTTGTTSLCYDSELKNIAASLFLHGYSMNELNHNPNISTNTLDHHHHHMETISTTLPTTAVVAAPVATSPVSRKAVDNFGQRTSIYRGVTRHRWTGRYEAHLWDNSCRREGQSRKGRQVYLGGYDKEDKAARAYDLAALKYWGPTTTTNFPVSNYEKELEDMTNMTRQEFVASLRRKSSGFSRGASIYRGVTRHHQHGRWQARIGRVAGNKDLYLGTFSTQEEAAEAYDIAAIKFRGLNAVTNFDMSRYDVKSIAISNLPIGGITGKTKSTTSESITDTRTNEFDQDFSSISTTTLSFGIPIKQDPSSDYWSNLVNGASQNNTSFHHYQQSSFANGSAMDLSSSFESSSDPNNYHNSNNNNNSLFFNGTSGCLQNHQEQEQEQEQEGYSTNGYGSWVTQSTPVCQNGKPNNLSVFQTPIFGME